MADEVETTKSEFDRDAAALLVKDLRHTFASAKTKSYNWRITQLKAILKFIDETESDIVEALRKDLHKPEQESFVYEINTAKASCKLAIQELRHWIMPEKVKTSFISFPSSAEIVSESLGIVLVISAWNYPFLLSLDPVIGAVAAGNAVVLKPSEMSQATSSLLAKLVEEHLDRSAIRVVEGAVAETSALLEQRWDKIFYTGSTRVGRIVMTAAAKYLTPVVLELGGKCPVVVDSNINLQVTARRIIVGKWGSNSGQACISPDYIITTKAFAPKLIDALKCELEKFYGKDQLVSKDLAHIVNSTHFARLSKLLDEDEVSKKIVHGGQRDESHLHIVPTILLDVSEDSLIMHEEIFGPLLPIITVDKLKECFDLITSRPKPLAAYLFTNDKGLKEEFVRTISAGGMVINDTLLHFATSSLPFGGVGESGMGAYHGKFSFDAFSHRKAVMYRGFALDVPARYPPYTRNKLSFLRALLDGGLLDIILYFLGLSKVRMIMLNFSLLSIFSILIPIKEV